MSGHGTVTLCVQISDQHSVNVEVSLDMDVDDVKTQLRDQLHIEVPKRSFSLVDATGTKLDPTQTLRASGIQNGDSVRVNVLDETAVTSPPPRPAAQRGSLRSALFRHTRPEDLKQEHTPYEPGMRRCETTGAVEALHITRNVPKPPTLPRRPQSTPVGGVRPPSASLAAHLERRCPLLHTNISSLPFSGTPVDSSTMYQRLMWSKPPGNGSKGGVHLIRTGDGNLSSLGHQQEEQEEANVPVLTPERLNMLRELQRPECRGRLRRCRADSDLGALDALDTSATPSTHEAKSVADKASRILGIDGDKHRKEATDDEEVAVMTFRNARTGSMHFVSKAVSQAREELLKLIYDRTTGEQGVAQHILLDSPRINQAITPEPVDAFLRTKGIRGRARSSSDPFNIYESHPVDTSSKACLSTDAVGTEVWAFGANTSGQTGTGGTRSTVTIPTVISSLRQLRITSLELGTDHALAVTESGVLHAWGRNDCGQLGLGDLVDRGIPEIVHRLLEWNEKVRSASCGSQHSACQTEGGRMYTWGAGSHGRLGHGNAQSFLIPMLVHFPKGDVFVTASSCGEGQTFALTRVGSVLSWGTGWTGRLGLGHDKGVQDTPLYLRSLWGHHITSICCGTSHVAAIDENGLLFTWGSGGEGRLGHNDERDCALPTQVKRLKKDVVRNVSCGFQHTACITSKNVLYTWGAGTSGQLGLGHATKSRSVPTHVQSIPGTPSQVSCGTVHTAVVMVEGFVCLFGSSALSAPNKDRVTEIDVNHFVSNESLALQGGKRKIRRVIKASSGTNATLLTAEVLWKMPRTDAAEASQPPALV